jgi:hypothetical protein
MKWVAVLVLLGLFVLYLGLGALGFFMSAFCFDAGTEPEAWNCFAGINLVAVLPSLICLIAGLVLLIMRRYKLSIAVAAIPAVVAAIGILVVFIANATYSLRP